MACIVPTIALVMGGCAPFGQVGRVIPPPTIESITPFSGPAAGDTELTIIRAEEAPAFEEQMAVLFDNVAAPWVWVRNDRVLNVKTPAMPPGLVEVKIVYPGGDIIIVDAGYEYIDNELFFGAPLPPSVNSVLPAQGLTTGGTVVTIQGISFEFGSVVLFGDDQALNVSVASGQLITVTTPPHAAGVVDVTVVRPSGLSATLPASFEFVEPPVEPLAIAQISPASGSPLGGTHVTVQGGGFAAGTQVLFGANSAASISVNTSQIMTAVTPPGTGIVDVVLVGPDGQTVTLANAFEYTAVGLSSLTPATGATAGGTLVTLNGEYFEPGAVVRFGDAAGSQVNVLGGSALTVRTPAHAPGIVDVIVENPDGLQATLPASFEFIGPAAPTLTSLAPNFGPIEGGTLITIQGTGLVDGAVVRFGDFAASAVNVLSATTATAVAPAHAAGFVDITIENLDGQSANLPAAYEYVAPAAPALASIAPAFGPVEGGTQVTIQGTGFLPGAIVLFGDAAASAASVLSPTIATAVAPAHAAGLVDVTIQNTDLQAATLPLAYEFIAPAAPTLASITPAIGPEDGGTQITLLGTGFMPGAVVLFGDAAASAIDVLSSTVATAIAPAHAAGFVDITVENPDGLTANLPAAYEYVADAAPTLVTLAPTNGPIEGGTLVTFQGTGFLPGAVVLFGDAAAASVDVLSSQIATVVAPAHAAGFVDITFENPDGQTANLPAAYEYNAPAAPTLASLAPNFGPEIGGTAVTIAGADFVAGAVVLFDGIAAGDVQVLSGGLISAVAPAHAAGAVDVRVDNPDGQSATLAASYTYVAPAAPTLGTIVPNFGPVAGGTAVTITGTGFVPGSVVFIDGMVAPDIVAVNPETITATTPAHAAGFVDVRVENPDGQDVTLAASFEYVAPAAPTIASFEPTSGPEAGGTAVTIQGTGFMPGATALFGGLAGVDVHVLSPTLLTVNTPPQFAGLVNVTVTNPDGQSVVAGTQYEYLAATLAVTAITPASGPIVGGTHVLISGEGFVPNATVLFGGVLAPTMDVTGPGTILAVTPPHAAGQVDVTVQLPDSSSATLANGFEYLAIPAPTITNIQPPDGPQAGGTTVAIWGDFFQPGVIVAFGTVASPEVHFLSANLITAVTPPALAPGAVDVSVLNPDGQLATEVNGFTYLAPLPPLPPPPPAINAVFPPFGPMPGGTQITVVGTDFMPGAAVFVANVLAHDVQFIAPNVLTARTPAFPALPFPTTPQPVDVRVVNPDGQTDNAAGAFTYVPAEPPVIDNIVPGFGPTTGGTPVTIVGSGFVPGSVVLIGGSVAADVHVLTPNLLTAVVPPHAPGAVTVRVVNPDGQVDAVPGGYTYVTPAAPMILGLTPDNGPAVGGTSVLIVGADFLPGAQVVFGERLANNVEVLSPFMIRCETPTYLPSPGLVDVIVVNPDLQSDTLVGGFQYP